MMTTFNLPDLGEGLQEAEIIAWQVGVGDHVVADQPLVSVETDKAVVEVPSPGAGRIAALRGAPGDITVYINSGNQGLQFAAVGSVVYNKAKAAGMGRELPTEWFLQDIRD